jgi:hypothetical protein
MIHIAKQIWSLLLNGYIDYFIIIILWLISSNLRGQQHYKIIFLKDFLGQI